MAFDFKKEYKEFYMPKNNPSILTVLTNLHYDSIGEAYAFLMRYAEQNGYQAAGPARECYIDGIWNKESEEDWLTEIQLPIE